MVAAILKQNILTLVSLEKLQNSVTTTTQKCKHETWFYTLKQYKQNIYTTHIPTQLFNTIVYTSCVTSYRAVFQ